MSVTLWIGVVFAVNILVGAALIAGVFKLMEQRVTAGAIGGLVVGTAVIYAESTLGSRMFNPTIAEMKFLVIAAAVGAVLGVTLTVLVFEPEI